MIVRRLTKVHSNFVIHILKRNVEVEGRPEEPTNSQAFNKKNR